MGRQRVASEAMVVGCKHGQGQRHKPRLTLTTIAPPFSTPIMQHEQVDRQIEYELEQDSNDELARGGDDGLEQDKDTETENYDWELSEGDEEDMENATGLDEGDADVLERPQPLPIGQPQQPVKVRDMPTTIL